LVFQISKQKERNSVSEIIKYSRQTTVSEIETTAHRKYKLNRTQLTQSKLRENWWTSKLRENWWT